MKTQHVFFDDYSNLTVNCQSLGIERAGNPTTSQLLDYCGDRITYNEANYIARDIKNKGRKDAKKSKK